jgi:hypothetical protein
MGKRLFLGLAAVAMLSLAGAASAGPECRCLYDGRTFDQGQYACIRIGGTARLARCGMALNNSSWIFVKDGCPSAALTPIPSAALASIRAPAF